ncbi:PQQ-binding-like beta-propeller repeat protein [Fimbriimonas ginsengisoli]|uniref:Cell surface protein n=1 Tax=Fimbriimonas ginsengisoli Gsoil 348 TaxID=661478 RepID=A0A068NV66_FIMGI|nr:PQQ-binding-like beta-propeller repeat protein [Fimbriimonas ginsengisoli]AIE87262.1 cell surface protein [Fimbriimonas ginsengisoli Gsoil 348]
MLVLSVLSASAAPALSAITIKPASIPGLSSAAGTVTLTASAPAEGILITLASDSDFIAVSATVAIPAGAKYATFTATSRSVGVESTATVTAAYGGVTKTAPLTVQATLLSAVVIKPVTVSGPGTGPGTVTLNGKAPVGGFTVNLSSDQAFVTVPASVTVAAGSSYTTFSATALAVPTTATANVTATANGVTKSAPLTVIAPLLTSCVIRPGTTNSYGIGPGTVVINSNAPVGGMVVTLSSDSSFVTVPASVTIPAGLKYATFSAVSTGVAVDSTATVTAASNGVAKTATLTVLAPVLTRIKLVYDSLYGGFANAGTVVLNANAPAGGIAVTLVSDRTDLAQPPASVTIPAGAKYATFTMPTTPSNVDATFNISATLAGVTLTAPVTIKANSLQGIDFTYDKVYGGNRLLGRVLFNGQAPAAGVVVSLSSDTPSLTLPATVTVAGGTTHASFYATSSPVSTSVLATITVTVGATTQTFTLTVLPGWSQIGGSALGTGRGGGQGATGVENWSYRFAGGITTPVSVASDGTVYSFTSDRMLTAFNPDGAVKWAVAFPLVGGNRSTSPALAPDGTIYLAAPSGTFYAINPDGSQKWTYDTGSSFTAPATVGPDGTIYGFANDKKLYAINPDGTQKWVYDTGGLNVPTSLNAPTIGLDGTVYVALSANLYAVNSDGSLKWTIAGFTNFIGAPSVGADGTLYIGYASGLYAIDPTNGAFKRNVSLGRIAIGSPSIAADGTIYVQTLSTLFSINPSTFTQNWSVPVASNTISPVIGADGTIYVGVSLSNKLQAINPADGSILWSLNTPGGGVFSLSMGSDGTVYLAHGGFLSAIK